MLSACLDDGQLRALESLEFVKEKFCVQKESQDSRRLRAACGFVGSGSYLGAERRVWQSGNHFPTGRADQAIAAGRSGPAGADRDFRAQASSNAACTRTRSRVSRHTPAVCGTDRVTSGTGANIRLA